MNYLFIEHVYDSNLRSTLQVYTNPPIESLITNPFSLAACAEEEEFYFSFRAKHFFSYIRKFIVAKTGQKKNTHTRSGESSTKFTLRPGRKPRPIFPPADFSEVNKKERA